MDRDAGIGGFHSAFVVLLDEANDANSAVPYRARTSLWGMKIAGPASRAARAFVKLAWPEVRRDGELSRLRSTTGRFHMKRRRPRAVEGAEASPFPRRNCMSWFVRWAASRVDQPHDLAHGSSASFRICELERRAPLANARVASQFIKGASDAENYAELQRQMGPAHTRLLAEGRGVPDRDLGSGGTLHWASESRPPVGEPVHGAVPSNRARIFVPKTRRCPTLNRHKLSALIT
jgi:hypothetical protein